MHKEVLSKQQLELLPLIKLFAKEYYLVGGTAIALHIGHRRSVDFDLFTNKNLKRRNIKNIIEKSKFPVQDILYENHEQMHLKEIFKTFFNEKLFREQLSYFKDIDDSEKLEYIGPEVKDEAIKEFLIDNAITPF
jgi:hypothetical protein